MLMICFGFRASDSGDLATRNPGVTQLQVHRYGTAEMVPGSGELGTRSWELRKPVGGLTATQKVTPPMPATLRAALEFLRQLACGKRFCNRLVWDFVLYPLVPQAVKEFPRWSFLRLVFVRRGSIESAYTP